MACGCNKRRGAGQSAFTASAGVVAGSQTWHEVFRDDGTATGRRFDSLVSAQRYADSIGGTIRPV